MKYTTKLMDRTARRERTRRFVEYLLFGIAGSFGAGAVTGLLELLLRVPVPAVPVVVISIGISTPVAALAALRSRLDRRLLVTRLEALIGSRSALATATDLFRHQPDHPFAPAIYRRAEAFAKAGLAARIERKAVRFLPLRGLALAPTLFLVFLASILVVELVNTRPIDDAVAASGSILEEYGDTLAARASEDSDSRSLDIAREMQELGRELSRNRLDRDEAEERLGDLSERIRERIAGLSRADRSGSVSSSSDRPETAQEAAQSPNTEEVTALMNQLVASGGIGESDAGFPEEVIEELEAGGETQGLDPEVQDRLFEEQRELESAERVVQAAKSALQDDQTAETTPPPTEGTGDRGATAGGGNRRPEAGGERGSPVDGSGVGEGSGASGVGTTAVEDRMTDDFQRSANTTSALAELSGDPESRDRVAQTVVRSLPETTTATIGFDNLERTYTRQIEEAVGLMRVPTTMRDYVREYFLALAAQAGNATNGGTAEQPEPR